MSKPIHEELLPIGVLLAAIAFVVWRLPHVDVGHTQAFRRRRALNWLPLGLTYAFLYMGRYNLTTLKDVGGITGAQFGDISGMGAMVYGLSFLLNGPLTDRWGGRATIMISAAGSALCNLAIGLGIHFGEAAGLSVGTYTLLYAANMYFQSFGAVSIVKVNASWFHVRERGTFGGIFGILISLGLYFAYDWGLRIARAFGHDWLFLVPAIILFGFAVACYFLVFDRPSDTGQADFDPADASSGDDGPRLPAITVIRRMMTNPIILTVALIELCSGFLRQGILNWYRDYSKALGAQDTFVYENWGMVSCIAGITGGMFAGLISDHLFGSRRGPVSAFLYGIMLAGSAAILFVLGTPAIVSWTIAFMAMAIIGVHGMLSGTASQDFGGKKNAGVAVGLIDGFVYLGATVQAKLYGHVLPEKGTAVAKDPASWIWWPGAMIPVALLGLVLALRVWNARPQAKSAAAR
jgi:OPA family glycerol-3-phosphate transporter-like MFS transporter